MKILLRSLIGIGLLAFVYFSGMLDLNLIVRSMSDPVDTLIIQTSLFVIVLFQALRWFVVNSAQGGTLTYKRTVEISLIVHFVAILSPSSVGMDVVRGWYSCGENASKQGKSIAAIVVERLIGMFALFFCAALAGYFLFDTPVKELKALVVFSGVVTFVGFVAVPIAARFGLTDLKSFWMSWVISLFVTASTIFPFVLVGQRLGIEMTLIQYLFLIPLGMIASSIPLTPFGIGVGQVAFYQLAQWLGTVPEKSAALITVIQAHSIVFALLCGLAYLKAGSRMRATTQP